MKKNYTSPAIETTEILVEQGIAVSNYELYWNNAERGFGLNENTDYDVVDFEW